jgi:hypothetical protein
MPSGALLLELDSASCLVDARAYADANSVPSRSIACIIIARRRARATLALRILGMLRLSPLCLNGCFVADQHEKNQKLVLSFQALSGKFRDQTSAI